DYLPILVLTAQTDMETRLKALEAGARDFVSKPFHKSEVLNRIRNMLEVRALYKERMRQNEILEVKVNERTIELRQRNAELEQTRLEIIRRLGRAGEYRDNETGMHVLRMSKSCHRLALAAGLDEDHAKLILHASPMHDVGKIGIPDDVLQKPCSLSPEEFEVIREHPRIGATLLGGSDIPLLQMAVDIALCHHEKWDGTGYPCGLSGKDIPEAARIVAIVDVYDALCHDRVYRAKPYNEAEVLAIMDGKRGSHFDPEMYDCFRDLLPNIRKIRQDFADPRSVDVD
ncbi:MAG: HD domain-containing protein, partial [Desulfobulbaceae bacterium]|nr:HD domain-containing protein [Desulfobulbaceae bacterium]